MKTQGFFIQTSEEEREEAKSYSIARWVTSGIYRIDLKKHENPFSYIYAGCYLNMLNRILRMRKHEQDRAEYAKKVMDEFKSQFPELSMNQFDITGNPDNKNND